MKFQQDPSHGIYRLQCIILKQPDAMEFPLFSEFLLWVTGKFHWLNLTIEVVSRKIHFNGDEGFIPREVSQKSPAMKNFTMNAKVCKAGNNPCEGIFLWIFP